MVSFVLFILFSMFFIVGAYNSASLHTWLWNKKGYTYSRNSAPTPLGYLLGDIGWAVKINEAGKKQDVLVYTNILALVVFAAALISIQFDGVGVYAKYSVATYLIGFVSYWIAWLVIPQIRWWRSLLNPIRQRIVGWWNEPDRALLRWVRKRANVINRQTKNLKNVEWLDESVQRIAKAKLPALIQARKRRERQDGDTVEVQSKIDECLAIIRQAEEDISLLWSVQSHAGELRGICENPHLRAQRDQITEIAYAMLPSLVEQRFRLRRGLDAIEKILAQYGEADESMEFEFGLLTETAKNKGILSVQYDGVEEQIDHCCKFLDHVEASLHAAALADVEPVEVDAIVDRLTHDIRQTEECTRRAVAETSAATARARMQVVGRR